MSPIGGRNTRDDLNDFLFHHRGRELSEFKILIMKASFFPRSYKHKHERLDKTVSASFWSKYNLLLRRA